MGRWRKACVYHTSCRVRVSSLLSDISTVAPSKPAADDPSAKTWLLSIPQAHKPDAVTAEGWKVDMNGILVRQSSYLSLARRISFFSLSDQVAQVVRATTCFFAVL